MKSIAAILSLSLAACYGAAPPRPPCVSLPAMADGVERARASAMRMRS